MLHLNKLSPDDIRAAMKVLQKVNPPDARIEFKSHPLIKKGEGTLIGNTFYFHPEDLYRWIFKFCGVNTESINACISHAQSEVEKIIYVWIKMRELENQMKILADAVRQLGTKTQLYL